MFNSQQNINNHNWHAEDAMQKLEENLKPEEEKDFHLMIAGLPEYKEMIASIDKFTLKLRDIRKEH